ncbi:MAG: signal recognition particle-docking protein FtsY [Cyanobium sp. M30B3]|nr:MAG: signal recognition particle-docking protein FtsY [Cyanobium sp. M30B3]
MVFDWFKRNHQPEPAAAEQEPPAAEAVEEHRVEAASAGGSDDHGSHDPDPAATLNPGSEPAVPAPPPPAPATTPAPAPDDALAWARQAYARLKAEQQAQKAGAQTPSAEPEPQTPAPAPVPPAASPAEPVGAPPANPDPAPSLLEQAAATRAERQQALTAPAELTQPTPATAVPAAAPVPAAPGAEEPQLGAFDDSFTWSAEVLAAQGRRPDQISLEEIDWLGRLRQGLEKTRRGFVTQLLDNLGDDPLTPEVLDDLETTLLRADVGVSATDQVLDALRQRLNQEVVDPSEGIRFLKEQLRGILDTPIEASAVPLLAPRKGRLNVWLLVGVNGVGKTTTLGKLANLAVRSGYSCLIAAADTFRAAAVQQVQVWGERSGVPVIANPSANADPAAVVYDAIGAAKAQGTELVLVDTAGRLQTKHNLMEELAKVRRIVDKLAPDAAVESLLVLDASQGQNGLRQAMAFASAAGLTGVVVTKLDGSARGGVALAVASEAGLPIRFIGAGEGIRDLRPFNSFEFVEALLAS